MSFRELIKKPSAFLPITMSLVVIAVMIYYFARFGIVHQTDEGTAAHIFQIGMAGQIPIILYFMVRWLPRHPRQGLEVLVFQALAALAAMGPVWYFKL